MMTTNGQKSLSAIGFLTIIRDPEQGVFGGYLVVNSVGRPLEFHCTAPVRPNRAQEILYGPTLEPYLYGERIGPTLLEKSKSRPIVVFTDVEGVLAARPFVATPIMMVLPEQAEPSLAATSALPKSSQPWRVDTPHDVPSPASGQLSGFSLGSYQLAVDPDHPEDQTALSGHWAELEGQIDLDEPFARIREAIDEARKGV